MKGLRLGLLLLLSALGGCEVLGMGGGDQLHMLPPGSLVYDDAGAANLQPVPGVDGGTDAGAGVQDGAPMRLDAALSVDLLTPAADLAPASACGVCDQIWVCNGFASLWSSEAGRCVNQDNGTALRCNGVLDGQGANGVGTWEITPSGLELLFDALGGGMVIIDCVP